jgi:signal transduction histidine kinase
VVNAASPIDRPRERLALSAPPPATTSWLYIGSARRSLETGAWSILIGRLLMSDGAVVGLLAAEVPTVAFSSIFTDVAASGDTDLALLLEDGTLIASGIPQDGLIGRRAAFAAPLAAALTRHNSGSLTGVAGVTGDGSVLLNYRRLPTAPLIVTAARNENEILAQWRTDCIFAALAFIVFALTAGGLTGLIVHALRRQQRAVAELRSGEDRLRQQQMLLQSTIENIGEGLSVFDQQGRLIAWNAHFIELLDLPRDLTSETTLQDILILQATRGDFGSVDPATEARERFDRFYRNVPLTTERVTAGGRFLQIQRHAMPGGFVVTLYSDITERKVAEQNIKRGWEEAELANRAKSDFLANMSHELRTPLNAIIGFSEVIAGEMLGPMLDKKYLEYIRDIHGSGMHLLAIVNDVLDMSKIEAGKYELSNEAVDVRQVIGESMRMVNEQANDRNIDLAVQQSPEDMVIFADERAIKQITLNLLSNAVKFSSEGGRIDIRATLDDANGFQLDIEDRGIGMTEAELERALQPFGQAKAVLTREHSGTGLGLPITKGLVEALGGQLAIETAAGRGTRVRVILPQSGAALAIAGLMAQAAGNEVQEQRVIA